MFLNKVIILQIFTIFHIKGIKNENLISNRNYKTLQAGTLYLNSEHPLWILKDQKHEQHQVKNAIKEKPKCASIESLKCNNRQQFQQQLPANARKIKSHHHAVYNSKSKAENRIRLPHNYIPLKKPSSPNVKSSSRRYRNSKFIGNMPVFDAIPGDESFTQSNPIFIYTGHKGRMLLNTMLSKDKYPMQEPVPGQVLYPPQSLVFKPKRLVENLRRKLNVTMIPFYAYEAIDPRNKNQPTTAISLNPARNPKKAKQYTAFFSPETVLSQPLTAPSQYHNDDHIAVTTTSAPTLEIPYANHRVESMPFSTTTSTSLPHKKLEVTYNDGEEKFQITYEDDVAHLESPLNVLHGTKSPSLPYESYTFDNNYYAFPIYTMAKLTKNDDKAQYLQQTNTDDRGSVERHKIENYIDTALKEEHDSLPNKSEEDTWFILNSKYKGPLKANGNSLQSSKYVQTSPAKVQEDRKKLSFHGENINFI